MEDYLNGIDEDLWKSIENGPYRAELVKVVGNPGAAEDMIAQGNKKKANEKIVSINCKDLFHLLFTILFVATKQQRRSRIP